jgi:hypothetical protein
VRKGMHRRLRGGDRQLRPIDLEPQLHVVDQAGLPLPVSPWAFITQRPIDLKGVTIFEDSGPDGPDVDGVGIKAVAQPRRFITHPASMPAPRLAGQMEVSWLESR